MGTQLWPNVLQECQGRWGRLGHFGRGGKPDHGVGQELPPLSSELYYWEPQPPDLVPPKVHLLQTHHHCSGWECWAPGLAQMGQNAI